MAVDFETANYSRDSACAIGLVKVEEGKIVDQAVHLIRPPSKQFLFTYIHGLTWEDVSEAPTFGELWSQIKIFLKGADFLAAHNAAFDQGVLRACCQRYNVSPPRLPFECSMKLARRHWRLFPTKLSDVCRHLKIQLNHHEALSDASACAQIFLAARQPVDMSPEG